MTEQEWLECTNPKSMLEFLRGKGSDRKFRLFAVACCYRIYHLLANDNEAKDALELVERFADGSATEDERQAVCTALLGRGVGPNSPIDWEVPYWAGSAVGFSAHPNAHDAATKARRDAVSASMLATIPNPTYLPEGSDDELLTNTGRTFQIDEGIIHCKLLRDIFGNPFRPVAFDPLWRTVKVTAIAQTIYEERRFADMPILADALEEAGCTSADILDHCRQLGDHVRGCWVVDLILAKQ